MSDSCRIGSDRPDDNSVIEGLDLILSHFDHQISLWPRAISTKTTEGRQITVYSREQAIARFKQANYLDCRISVYPYSRSTTTSTFGLAPDLIMIDLDAYNFDNDDVLERVLEQTVARIKNLLELKSKPTVISSGNGYHIYIPIDVIVLEEYREFSNVDQPSIKFIRFAEWYLSDGKSDTAHNTTVSLNNCMLRIPSTINSKNGAQVSIVNKFDLDKLPLPKINLIMGSFLAYLKEMETRDKNLRKTAAPMRSNCNNSDKRNNTYYYWIERLLQTPLPDYRKNCVWRILAPYLINVRNLSYDESFSVILNWLDKCSNLRRLGFNAKLKIRQDLNSTIKTGYNPISLSRLNSTDNRFYKFLQNHGIVE